MSSLNLHNFSIFLLFIDGNGNSPIEMGGVNIICFHGFKSRHEGFAFVSMGTWPYKSPGNFSLIATMIISTYKWWVFLGKLALCGAPVAQWSQKGRGWARFTPLWWRAAALVLRTGLAEGTWDGERVQWGWRGQGGAKMLIKRGDFRDSYGLIMINPG